MGRKRRSTATVRERDRSPMPQPRSDEYPSAVHAHFVHLSGEWQEFMCSAIRDAEIPFFFCHSCKGVLTAGAAACGRCHGTDGVAVTSEETRQQALGESRGFHF